MGLPIQVRRFEATAASSSICVVTPGWQTSRALKREVTNAVATHPPQAIVDLGGPTFIASRAMGGNHGISAPDHLQGGKAKIVSTSRVRDALEIARLHEVLQVCDTVEEALKD